MILNKNGQWAKVPIGCPLPIFYLKTRKKKVSVTKIARGIIQAGDSQTHRLHAKTYP